MPFYMSTVDRYSLAICCKWLSQFRVDDIGQVYDSYIAEFSMDCNKPTKTSAIRLQCVLL